MLHVRLEMKNVIMTLLSWSPCVTGIYLMSPGADVTAHDRLELHDMGLSLVQASVRLVSCIRCIPVVSRDLDRWVDILDILYRRGTPNDGEGSGNQDGTFRHSSFPKVAKYQLMNM